MFYIWGLSGVCPGDVFLYTRLRRGYHDDGNLEAFHDKHNEDLEKKLSKSRTPLIKKFNCQNLIQFTESTVHRKTTG